MKILLRQMADRWHEDGRVWMIIKGNYKEATKLEQRMTTLYVVDNSYLSEEVYDIYRAIEVFIIN